MRCLLTALLLAAPAFAEPDVLDKTTTGSPEIQSIEALRFGPGGVLFIADGRGAQVVAVATGGDAAKPGFAKAIDKIDAKIAGKLGLEAKDIEIVDLIVHPVTNVAFVAVRTTANKKALILTIDGEGKVSEFSLEKVKYAKLALPAGEKAPVTRVTDMVWMGDRLLVAGLATEEFGSKLFSFPGPLSHEAKGAAFSTETYHVAHGKWETKAPMTSLMVLVEENKKYVAGAFACTPVVKYPLDDLKPGDKVKGYSMVELGNGNRPLNMLSYEKEGKHYVLMNNQRMDRFHKSNPVGPSPYWAARIDRDILLGNDKDKINQKAVLRVDRALKPLTDKITVAEDFHGVRHMDKLGADKALAIKEGKDGLSLTAIALP